MLQRHANVPERVECSIILDIGCVTRIFVNDAPGIPSADAARLDEFLSPREIKALRLAQNRTPTAVRKVLMLRCAS